MDHNVVYRLSCHKEFFNGLQICHQRYTTCSLSITLLLTGFPVVALRGDDIYRSTSI